MTIEKLKEASRLVKDKANIDGALQSMYQGCGSKWIRLITHDYEVMIDCSRTREVLDGFTEVLEKVSEKINDEIEEM